MWAFAAHRRARILGMVGFGGGCGRRWGFPMARHDEREGRIGMARGPSGRGTIDAEELVGDREYRGLRLDGTVVKHKDLEGCSFVDCSFVGADLTGSRFNGSAFRSCDFSNARIAGCNLFSAAFERCKMIGLDFRDGVNLTATTFRECNLSYAVFRGLALTKMKFECCSLIEADLSLTDLKQASLVGCDLARVDIQGAAFWQTDLRGADLTGWDLKRHDLRGIVVTPDQFAFLATEIGIQIIDS